MSWLAFSRGPLDPGMEPMSPAWQANSTTEPPGGSSQDSDLTLRMDSSSLNSIIAAALSQLHQSLSPHMVSTQFKPHSIILVFTTPFTPNIQQHFKIWMQIAQDGGVGMHGAHLSATNTWRMLLHVKRWSQTIRELEIRTTVRCHLTFVRTAIIKSLQPQVLVRV